jgi:transcriptional regulator with XRE-family HTH domain
MTLKDWLAKQQMSDAEFARMSGIGQRALVQKYRLGRQTPALRNMLRIRAATSGAVTANDFLDQLVGTLVPATPIPSPAMSKRRRRIATASPTKQPAE